MQGSQRPADRLVVGIRPVGARAFRQRFKQEQPGGPAVSAVGPRLAGAQANDAGRHRYRCPDLRQPRDEPEGTQFRRELVVAFGASPQLGEHGERRASARAAQHPCGMRGPVIEAGESLPGPPFAKVVAYGACHGLDDHLIKQRMRGHAAILRDSPLRVQDGLVQDWADWHLAYEDPTSALSARLARVRAHLAAAVDRSPPGRISLVSLCAGEGRDVCGVLPGHQRRDDVEAVLVESDHRNAAAARHAAMAAGLRRVEVREADASLVTNFADALPAQVLLLCGIFGNISDADIERTVRAAAALCAPGGTVIWTRHRRPPDLTSAIRTWFERDRIRRTRLRSA